MGRWNETLRGTRDGDRPREKIGMSKTVCGGAGTGRQAEPGVPNGMGRPVHEILPLTPSSRCRWARTGWEGRWSVARRLRRVLDPHSVPQTLGRSRDDP